MAVRLGLSEDPESWYEQREAFAPSRGLINVGNLFLLPEDNTFVALDHRRRGIAADSFT
jgi:hypothetical protein